MLDNLATPESLDVQISVAQQAFAIMADIEVFPSSSPDACLSFELADGPTFAAIVRYLGECNGSLSLECSPSVAFAFTQRVLGIATPLELDSDVSDAIGELINTIGGNLKGLLPAHTRLDTPQVHTQLPGHRAMPSSSLSCLNFDSEFGAFRLILLPSQ